MLTSMRPTLPLDRMKHPHATLRGWFGRFKMNNGLHAGPVIDGYWNVRLACGNSTGHHCVWQRNGVCCGGGSVVAYATCNVLLIGAIAVLPIRLSPIP